MWLTMIPTSTTDGWPTAVATDDGSGDWENAVTLTATTFADDWNGFRVPVVNAATFRQYIHEMALNDPNGLWNADGVREAWIDADGDVMDEMPEDDLIPVWPVLVYDDGENDPDVFHALASDDITGGPLADDNWATLYLIDGWTWETVREDRPARRLTVAGRISPDGVRIVTESRAVRAATLSGAFEMAAEL